MTTAEAAKRTEWFAVNYHLRLGELKTSSCFVWTSLHLRAIYVLSHDFMFTFINMRHFSISFSFIFPVIMKIHIMLYYFSFHWWTIVTTTYQMIKGVRKIVAYRYYLTSLSAIAVESMCAVGSRMRMSRFTHKQKILDLVPIYIKVVHSPLWNKCLVGCSNK